MDLENAIKQEELIKMFRYYESSEEAKIKLADSIADKNIAIYLKYLKHEENIKKLDVAEKFLNYAKMIIEKKGQEVRLITYFIKRFLEFKELRKKIKHEQDVKEKTKIQIELKKRGLWEI